MNAKFYKCCAVPMCKSTTITTPDKLFIHVPKNKQVRRKWLKLAGRETAALSTTSTAYFCEDHFDLQNDMENYVEYTTMGFVSRIIMKPGCLPRKFACQPDGPSSSLDLCQPAMGPGKNESKIKKIALIKECKEQDEIKVDISQECENLNIVPNTSSEIPNKCHKDISSTEPNPGIEPETSRSAVVYTTAAPPRQSHLQNTVPPKEDSPKKVEDVKPVVKSEMSAEHTTNGKALDSTVYSTGFTTSERTSSAPKEISDETRYWKTKLTQILHSTKFCGVCLSTDGDVNSIYDQFEIVVCDRSHTTTLANILYVVFAEMEDLLSNSHICDKCTSQLIQSYMFIQQARETSRILNCYVNDLYNKSCYNINKNHLKATNQKQIQTHNVVISVDNYDNIHRLYNIHSEEQTKKVEKTLDRLKYKRKFKCLKCNAYLPSRKAWTLHKISTHHKNKYFFKAQPILNRPNARVSKKKCRTCHGIIEAGGFVEHMKKHHGQLRLCSICNVTFSSFKDFVTHKHESHYKADRKCLTCLGSFSEVGLEQHQCRFGCGSCTEVPCVHHKYLMCYRDQILNGKLAPKCLECYYVCRTKEAMLKHVNLCHLKLRHKVS